MTDEQEAATESLLCALAETLIDYIKTRDQQAGKNTDLFVIESALETYESVVLEENDDGSDECPEEGYW